MLPNATAVLVLGICSIVFGCFYIGLVLGIIGLVLANKSRKMYRENPTIWDGYSQLNAGWIMSIIGIVLGAIYIVYVIVMFAIFGAFMTSFWNMSQYS
ncbi:DUF4190 domain-containing protein [Pseudoflavitalea sp. G-6-1-2]|uniref:CCC motif membrane protein n=1 Tax=Pseudoflavitalea sp. G-6-1-2 TaxID=2728841 RepID=UPI00146EE682|nr:CCC motif membrane protein [Pseudoflavitalea sp. G-6-1-2]NML22526.1 DUF4190 domain-containing protein [Pseudoflavitalea sp. G-6-1-2]